MPRLATDSSGFVRPSFHLFGRTWPFYGLCVCSGVVAGSLFACGLARAAGLSAATTAAVLALGVAAAIALALATERLLGVETYTFYHYQVAVLAACAGVLAAWGKPVPPYLDAVALALGLVQAVGRLGCLMAGCCHGRPCGWGIRYGRAHAEHGFEPALVGVPLFPVQAVEALGLAALVAAGAALALSGRPAGTALGTYLAGYGALRFVLELARGDAARPYKLGFSEAQWTATAGMALVVSAELAGLLPRVPWHGAALALVLLAAGALALHRRRRPAPTHRLLHPRHLAEVAGILCDLGGAPGEAAGSSGAGAYAAASAVPRVAVTSEGIRLSGGGLADGCVHYALSARDAELTAAAAESLAELILRLRHRSEKSRLLRGGHGVFHLLVGAP